MYKEDLDRASDQSSEVDDPPRDEFRSHHGLDRSECLTSFDDRNDAFQSSRFHVDVEVLLGSHAYLVRAGPSFHTDCAAAVEPIMTGLLLSLKKNWSRA